MIKTIEVYDTFRPERLLDIKFIESNDNYNYVRSCRSSYYSLRDIIIQDRLKYEPDLAIQKFISTDNI